MPPIGCGQAPPLADFRRGGWKDKVVVVMGATGTGKSRLAIDLASHFGGEVVNSDKMQVYDGLAIVTNKVTDEERAGIPHHLLGGVPPDADFTASDFRRAAVIAVESIAGRGLIPIIAGGSNSYVEELIEGDCGAFRERYDCCFLWVDVELPVLHGFVAERVDQMVDRGLVEEVRGVFDPWADYSRGVRRAIGVPEMDRYLRAELGDEGMRARLLAEAIDEIKANTYKLACCQLRKIRALQARWDAHRVDATAVFEKHRWEADRAWVELVAGPSIEIVGRFLREGSMDDDGVVAMESGAASAAVLSAARKTKLLSTVEAVGPGEGAGAIALRANG